MAGELAAQAARRRARRGKILEVRGAARQLGRPRPPSRLPRGDGARAASSTSSRSSATGTTAPRRRSTADAIAVHGKFDGIFTQGGSTGAVRALMDASHPFVPIAGEAENGFRKLFAEHAKDGLKGWSYGQSPGLVAISIKAAISALEGNLMPQLISVPIPIADYTTLQGRARTTGPEPDRQLLHRQRVPALRRQHHGAGDHGARREEHAVGSQLTRPGGRRRLRRRPLRCHADRQTAWRN